MKFLILFVAIVLSWSTINMFQLGVTSEKIEAGVGAYINKYSR